MHNKTVKYIPGVKARLPSDWLRVAPSAVYFNKGMNQMMKFILSIAILLALQTNSYGESHSSDGILTIDESTPKILDLKFPNKNNVEPKISEFQLTSSILMSSRAGERWATLTIKNNSSHQRLLDKEHIVAIFANGETRNPTQAKHLFTGNEEITIIINFGESKFPVLRVNVRN